jgi:hypothetical protein
VLVCTGVEWVGRQGDAGGVAVKGLSCVKLEANSRLQYGTKLQQDGVIHYWAVELLLV